jgi:hypothetical protein
LIGSVFSLRISITACFGKADSHEVYLK